MCICFPKAPVPCASCWAARGATFAEMTNLGMPVPQGFTVTTEACTRYYEDGQKIAKEIEEEILRISRQDGADLRQEVRRCGKPSACLRAQARARPCPA